MPPEDRVQLPTRHGTWRSSHRSSPPWKRTRACKGCYSHEIPVALCVDPARAPVTSFHAACQDCLMFHVGSLASLLPPGTTQYTLAQELAAHIRTVRG